MDICPLIDDIAEQSVVQLTDMGLDRRLGPQLLGDIAHALTSHMFHTARDLIDRPEDREQIIASLLRVTTSLFVGAIATADTSAS